MAEINTKSFLHSQYFFRKERLGKKAKVRGIPLDKRAVSKIKKEKVCNGAF